MDEKGINNLPIELIPMDGNVLAEIDYGRKIAIRAIDECRYNVVEMAKSAQRIDIHGASQLSCYVQAQNVKKVATEISQYLGIVEMLLAHMKDDLNAINNARNQFRRDYLLRMAQKEALQKENEKRQADAERIANKRASERAEAD